MNKVRKRKVKYYYNKIASYSSTNIMQFDFNKKYEEIAINVLYPKFLEISILNEQLTLSWQKITDYRNLRRSKTGEDKYVKIWENNEKKEILWNYDAFRRITAELREQESFFSQAKTKRHKLYREIDSILKTFFKTEVLKELNSKRDLIKENIKEGEVFKSIIEIVKNNTGKYIQEAYDQHYIVRNFSKETWYLEIHNAWIFQDIRTNLWRDYNDSDIIFNHVMDVGLKRNSEWPKDLLMISSGIIDSNKKIMEMVGDRIAKEYNDTAEDKKTFRELPWALSAVKKVFEYSIETTLNSMNRFIEELYREEAIKELKELNLWGMSNAAQIASEFNDVLELHDITERDDMINAIIRITEAGNIAGNIVQAAELIPLVFNIPNSEELEGSDNIDTEAIIYDAVTEYIKENNLWDEDE